MSDGAHDRRLHSAYDGLYGQAVDKQVLALLRYGAGASVPKTTHTLGNQVRELCKCFMYASDIALFQSATELAG